MKSLLVLPPRRSFTYTTLFFTCTILSYISIGFHAMCDAFSSSFYNLPDIQYGPHNTSFRGYSSLTFWGMCLFAFQQSSAESLSCLQGKCELLSYSSSYWFWPALAQSPIASSHDNKTTCHILFRSPSSNQKSSDLSKLDKGPQWDPWLQWPAGCLFGLSHRCSIG